MAIVSGDIDFFLSGGSANTDPNASLGGNISTTEITNATLHNLFDVVSSGEATSGDTEYRCIYVKNSHGSLTLMSPVIWIDTNTPSADTTIAIALGNSAVNGSETAVGDESTDPSVTDSFASPSTKGAGKSLGDLPPGQHKAVWIKRIVDPNAASAASDSFVLKVEGATLP